jgi:hypothetical protein
MHQLTPASVEAIKMLDATTKETQDAVTGIQPTVARPQSPVLVTEQQVMFGTAAAVRPPSTHIPFTRRMSGALRVVAAALTPPPPRPSYPRSGSYLERGRMAREMERL